MTDHYSTLVNGLLTELDDGVAYFVCPRCEKEHISAHQLCEACRKTELRETLLPKSKGELINLARRYMIADNYQAWSKDEIIFFIEECSCGCGYQAGKCRFP